MQLEHNQKINYMQLMGPCTIFISTCQKVDTFCKTLYLCFSPKTSEIAKDQAQDLQKINLLLSHVIK